eukprot:13864007-Ditylum_brightwellii.AAC.1
MATLQIIHNNMDLATIIKNICHREEVKQAFNLICPITKGQQGGVVSFIKALAPLTSIAMHNGITNSLGFKHT